jgi:hypothetical protein
MFMQRALTHVAICILILSPRTAKGAAESRGAETLPARLAASPPARPVVAISPATTYIVKPLGPDGRPDYLTALERVASEGVTLENNAAVVLARALGPSVVDPADRKVFFRTLGIGDLPEQGQYFVEYYAWVKKQAPRDRERAEVGGEPLDHYHQQLRSETGPWSKQECPLVARWLAEMERPLTLAAEASKRTRYYVPRISHGDPRMLTCSSTYDNQVHSVSYIARALAARANLSLREGNIERAWDDLATAHRLARLFGQGKSWIEGKGAHELALTAWRGQQRIGQLGRLTSHQVRRFRADLDRLTPIPPIMQFGLTERFEYLDVICYSAYYGIPKESLEDDPVMTKLMHRIVNEMEEMTHKPAKVEAEPTERAVQRLILLDASRRGDIKWNAALKQGNDFFDRLQAAGRKTDLQARRTAVVAVEADYEAVRLAASKSVKALAEEFSKTRAVRPSSDVVTRFLVLEYLTATGLASARFYQEAVENHAVVEGALTGTVLAIGGYRTEHGRYPEKLQELIPKYLDRVPIDPLSGGETRYRQTTGGYLLYSVGPNRKDDGGPPPEGTSYYDPRPLESDDVGIRVTTNLEPGRS